VSPDDFAAKYPRLFHVAAPAGLPGILRNGLLPTSQLLDLFEVAEHLRPAIQCQRRSADVRLTHPIHGEALISDNRPLSEKALRACLEDGLTPWDWLLMLNSRAFLWPDEAAAAHFLEARLARIPACIVLVLDSHRLLKDHYEALELSRINSGSTIRRPARRGLSTFVPISQYRNEVGGRRIREVAVVGGIANLASHLVDQYHVSAPVCLAKSRAAG
jgi:hypothetical protein